MHARPVTLSSSYAAGFSRVQALLYLLAAGAGAAIVVALVHLSGSLATTRDELIQANTKVESLSAQVATLEARTAAIQKAVSAVNAASQQTRQELRDAYKANPTWSASPVPQPVVDSLCKRGNCAKPVDRVSAPAD